MDNISNISKEELLLELQEVKKAYASLQVLYQNEIKEKHTIESKFSSQQVLSEIIFQEHKSVMLLLDPLSGKIIDANKSAVQFYKYPIDQLRGMPITTINVSSRDQIEIDKAKALKQEQNLFIFPHRISSGEIRQVEVHSSPVEMNGQKLLFSIIHDITEREADGMNLKKSEDALRNAEEMGKFGNWSLLLDEKLIRASVGAILLYGFGQNEIPYEDVKEMALSEYRPMLNKAMDDLILGGKQYDVEYKIKRKSDGKIIDLHAVAKYDASKNIVFGTIQDISERKRTEKALIDSEEKYHSLYIHMIEGAALHQVVYNEQDVAIDYIILETNPAFESQLNISRESVIGKSSREAYGVDDPPFLDIYSKVALTGDPEVFETYFPPLQKHFSISVYSPYKGSFATIFVDITERIKTEHTIRESERRYHGLLDHLDAGIVVHAADTSVILVNPRAAELLGLSEEQINGKEAIDPQWKFLLDDLSPMTVEDYPVNRIISSKKPIKEFLIGVNRPLAKDVVWLRVNGLPILDENGEINEVLISFSDITERKKIEDNLLESQQLLHEAQRLAQIGIWNWDKETNTSTWSEELSKIVGRNPGLPVPAFKDQQLFFTPKSYEQFASSIEKVMETGHRTELELEIIYSDGSLRNVNAFIGKKFSSKGKVIGLYGTLQDITDRKRAEAELRETNAYLENLINYANAPIIVWDPQFRITRFNHAFESLTGRLEADVLGKSLDLLFPPEFAENSMQLIRKTVSGERWETVEIKILNINSSVYTVLWNSATLFGPDGKTIIATIAQGQDISKRKQAEDAVNKSRALLNRSQEIANLGSWELDIESGQLIWSDEVYHILGFSPQEFTATYNAFLEAIHPDDRVSVDAAYSGSITNDKDSYEIEHRVVRKTTGEQRFVYEKCEHIRNATGKIVRSVGSILDITERKQGEVALQKSKNQLNQILQTTDQGIYGIDQNGCCTFINQSGLNELGYQVNECIGLNMHYLIHHSYPDGSQYNVQDCPIFQVNLTGEGSRAENEVFWRKNGSSFPVEYSSYPIIENGEITGAVITFADITERKQAGEELRLSEERFRKMADLLPQIIFETDVNGNFTFVNKQAFKIFGYPEDYPIIGTNSVDFHAPEDKTRVVENVKGRLSGMPPESNEYKMLRKDGTTFQALIYSNPIIRDSKPIGLRGIIVDITDRKQVEEEMNNTNAALVKLVAEKNKFFSIIAHDLRSPFNGFLGLTQIMAEKLPELTMDEIQKIAVSMRTSATNLFRLLENLLQWARIEQGVIPFNPKFVSLQPLVIESISMSLEPALKKGIELDFSVSEDIEAFADTNMLQTVIRNIVSNAVKYTNSGGKILLSAKAVADKNIEITVQDSGIGMSSEMLDNLFRINVQTNRKGTAGEPSTGLGLIICKEFVEKHGGKLNVESNAGSGSIFRIILPLPAQLHEKTSGINSETQKNIHEKPKGLKILIAEDDETSSMLISMALKSFSKEILKAGSGFEAVEICKNIPDIDLILMDIKMPGMDGYEATRQIREFNKDVFIVAQTAFGKTGDSEKAVSAGFNEFLSKPLSVALLKELIVKNFTV